jgi:putative membrane protein
LRIYNPKEWFGILFQFHRSDTLRKLGWLILLISFYAAGVVWLETQLLVLREQSYLKNVYYLHSLLGFALSLLLVFRTNTAYDRWWEGRKLWGTLVNSSRNMAIKLHALLPAADAGNRKFFKTSIALYAVALKNHLRSVETIFELDDEHHVELKANDYIDHDPNRIMHGIVSRIHGLQAEGRIARDSFLILNPEIQAFTDTCGACERIKNTPIPYSYSAFIKKFFFIYIMTLPFGYVYTLGYWVAPVVGIVFYVLASLELIAEEIEDPFGHDANDLPLDKLCDNIRKQVDELL